MGSAGADLGSFMRGVQLLNMCTNLAPTIDARTSTLHFLPYGRDYG